MANRCEVKGNLAPASECTWQKRILHFFTIGGPGCMAMLADTDAGSIVTAAQSGARWGYRLLWLQILLIPILYLVQELTVRLGLSTGKGQGSLIHEHFGRGWAWMDPAALPSADRGESERLKRERCLPLRVTLVRPIIIARLGGPSSRVERGIFP